MKNLIIKLAVALTFFSFSSFKGKTSTGYVTLEVSSVGSGGGSATVINTDTNVSYNIIAVDTYGQTEVPEGNYILSSAGTNSCPSPLIQGLTTSTGEFSFVIDADNPGFTIMASCY